MAVAGTHGKTTTTTLVAWLNHVMTGGGAAFLGGISKNFDSNLVLGTGTRLAVEADEYDRSFLRLNPDVAVVTSVDPDHLDIYGTWEAVREAFTQFVANVDPLGVAIINKKADIRVTNSDTRIYSYSLDDPSADFRAENIEPAPGGSYTYDIVTPDGRVEGCTLGITGRINVENSIAAVAMMWAAAQMQGRNEGCAAGCAEGRNDGCSDGRSDGHTDGRDPSVGSLFDHDKLRRALATFRGVRRRFEFHVNTPAAAYMDDYAHHPEELAAALASLRAMFPGRKITAIFQPHLYTRTRDLHREFAEALSAADELILTDIYPARELPIEGVTSEMIGREATIPWRIVPREQLARAVADTPTDVVVTFGAGNIENHTADIAAAVLKKAAAERNE
jgi:UDP-N-acetylmuramate--alanine ligase